MEHPDAELYERAATGDDAALAALLGRYLPQLHAYVHARLSADVRARESSLDVVQSVCRDLLAERGRFDVRREQRFRAWLFTAALNKIRDMHRFHRGARGFRSHPARPLRWAGADDARGRARSTRRTERGPSRSTDPSVPPRWTRR